MNATKDASRHPIIMATRIHSMVLRGLGAMLSGLTLLSCSPALHSSPALHGGTVDMATATFAAGCFWGIEAAFSKVRGVTGTAVGYMGGATADPTYEDVCTDRTGHAEVVQVTYDPGMASYDQLLEVFWSVHDPTQVNRQGPDVGTQYRSAIFFHTPEQQAAAAASKSRLDSSGKLRRPVTTEIVPAQTFYRAEEYHQKYLAKRGLDSCHIP